MDIDKAIKRSAEDNSGGEPRKGVPQVERDSDLWNEIMDAIGLSVPNYQHCSMANYEDRDDILVNFWVSDDPTALFPSYRIVSFRYNTNTKEATKP